MIAKRMLVLCLLGISLMEITGSPVSFPTERSDLEDSNEGDDTEGRFNHGLHQEKRKRKRMKLACLLALQQQNNRYRRAAPGRGEERTFFWGGLNVYDTDIHVYNGGYGGSKPSYSPGASSNPCSGFPALTGLPSLPSLPSLPNFSSLPSLPSFGNIGNEVVHVVRPGSSSSPTTSSSSYAPVSTAGTSTGSPGGLGSFGNGPASVGGGDGDNEDYDYSDGGSSGDSNRIKKRRRPTQSTNGLFSNIRPVIDRTDSYLDQFLFRPIDRTFRQIVRWL